MMAAPAVPVLRVRRLLADLIELTKPRLTGMAVITTMCSLYLGMRGPVDYLLVLHTLVGTAMMGAGGATLNQVLERDVDSRMHRTRNRPLPTRRMAINVALTYGLILSFAAPLYLAATVNLLTGALAVVALVTYVLAYTPLKTRTPLCTVVGAVPGALPCMMGWTAARNEIGTEALVLFAILFLWQIPHFLSIAWMYREEYREAGLPMLPVVEPDGASTFRQVIIWTMILLPVSMAPTLLNMTGRAYFFEAFALGLVFLAFSVNMAVVRDRVSARRLLLCSVIYLPLLQAALLLNKVQVSLQ